MDKMDYLIEDLKTLYHDNGILTERDVSSILSKYSVSMILVDEIFEQLDKLGISISDDNISSSLEMLTDGSESIGKQDKSIYWIQQQDMLNEIGSVIKEEFFYDFEKPRIQSSYMPLVILSFFDRTDIDYRLPFNKMIEYFKNYYAKRKIDGLIVERKDSIFCKSAPTDNVIKRLILFNPLGRSCLVKYIRYEKENDELVFNENLWQALSKEDIDQSISIARKLLMLYYSKLN